MAKCDICGKLIIGSNNEYCPVNGKYAYFCQLCGKEYVDLKTGNADDKETARDYFKGKAGNASLAGQEFINQFVYKKADLPINTNEANRPDAQVRHSIASTATASFQSNKSALILFILGIIWIIVAIILFFKSEVKLDRESAKYLGVDSVANFQGTIFTIGTLIVGTLNIIGGVIVNEIGKLKK